MRILFQNDDESEIRTEVIDDVDIAAMETDMVDVPEWIANFIQEKIRRRTDKIVEKSGLGSKHTDVVEKKQIVMELKKQKHPLLKSAKDKIPLEHKKQIDGDETTPDPIKGQ